MDRREVCYDDLKFFLLFHDVCKVKPFADIE